MKKNQTFSTNLFRLVVSLALFTSWHRADAQEPSWKSLPNTLFASLCSSSGAANDTALFYIANIGNTYETATSAIYRYSFTTSSWSKLTDVPRGMFNCSLQAADGCLFVTGGDQFLDVNYCFNLSTREWSQKAAMPTPRQHIAYSSTVLDSFIYITGGLEQGNMVIGSGNFEKAKPSCVNERYNFKSNKWEQLAPMPTPRQNPAVVALDSLVYVIGGEGDSKSVWNSRKTVEIYHPGTNTWTTGPDLPYQRSMTGAVVINHEIWLLCGWKDGYNNKIDNRIFIYNADSVKWRTLSVKTPKLIAYAAITTRNGNIYVMNGCNESFSTYNSAYELSLTSNANSHTLREKGKFILYPNPSSGLFSAVFENETAEEIQVDVFSSEGKTVRSQSWSGRKKELLDLTDQPKGIYWVKAISNGKIYTDMISIR